ncbi:MAG: LuxR C-terminal-related transcriptional regulator [Pseudomonadota bacterium]|nr:LuxR C-terminal-related transcriptional regulator [Pseudomonadota bacterium]
MRNEQEAVERSPEERLAELISINRLLEQENAEKKAAEEALRNREAELESTAKSLEELNSALKVLLKHREDDKNEVGVKVIANVKELVLPYVEKLKSTPLNEIQTILVEIVEMHLNEITSPFLMKLTSTYLGFTPKEIQVASLIRDGKKTKEIAKIMNVSKSAIDLHRNHIRNKLGLNNKKVNLRSYLSAMP